jgi:hypothetical protein
VPRPTGLATAGTPGLIWCLCFRHRRGKSTLRRTHFRSRCWMRAVRASVREPCPSTRCVTHTPHSSSRKASTPRPSKPGSDMPTFRTTLQLYGHLFEGYDETAAEATPRFADRGSRTVVVGESRPERVLALGRQVNGRRPRDHPHGFARHAPESRTDLLGSQSILTGNGSVRLAGGASRPRPAGTFSRYGIVSVRISSRTSRKCFTSRGLVR